MRPATTISTIAALLALGGCANERNLDTEYDDVAHIIGASIATPDQGGEAGALFDAAILARGGRPVGISQDPSGLYSGIRGGVSYVYLVVCDDASGARLDVCSPATERATVVADWDGGLVMPTFKGTTQREGMWTLDHLSTPMATVTGTSAVHSEATFARDDGTSVTYKLTATNDVSVLLDMGDYSMRGGTIGVTVQARTDHAIELTAGVTLDQRHTATIQIYTHFYVLDLDTGEVTTPIVL